MDPDDAVLYNEFVDLARDHGLLGIEVQVVQAPGEANGYAALVRATARTAQGGFDAVGEASPRSAPEAWRPFLTTLAELRAKARALRELTGADHAVREELSTPYGPRGEGDEEPAAPITRPAAAYSSAARAQAPVNLAPRPTPAPAPAVAQSGDPDEDDEDAGGAEEPEVEAAPPPGVAVAVAPEPDDELPPDFEGIGKDMEAKLLKLAMSIAALEGSDISEAEAREKLDAFFTKAFKHPFKRASRLEGQRVVQRLSGDLSRLRTESSRAGGDE